MMTTMMDSIFVYQTLLHYLHQSTRMIITCSIVCNDLVEVDTIYTRKVNMEWCDQGYMKWLFLNLLYDQFWNLDTKEIIIEMWRDLNRHCLMSLQRITMWGDKVIYKRLNCSSRAERGFCQYMYKLILTLRGKSDKLFEQVWQFQCFLTPHTALFFSQKYFLFPSGKWTLSPVTELWPHP